MRASRIGRIRSRCRSGGGAWRFSPRDASRRSGRRPPCASCGTRRARSSPSSIRAGRRRRREEALGFGGSDTGRRLSGGGARVRARHLVLGTAPRGGNARPRRPGRRRRGDLASGLHVVSGMHEFLSDDGELAALARPTGSRSLGRAAAPRRISASRRAHGCPGCPVVLTVGSDCNTGKMTAGMEIHLGLLRDGVRSGFAASGQTGIMITGAGIPVDRVIADFIGGATERLVRETAPGERRRDPRGAGLDSPPGLRGGHLRNDRGGSSAAHTCSVISRRGRRSAATAFRFRRSAELVRLYEDAVAGMRRIPVVGVALNTFDLDEDAARSGGRGAARETGLPATDPVRFGAGSLVGAIGKFRGSGGEGIRSPPPASKIR